MEEIYIHKRRLIAGLVVLLLVNLVSIIFLLASSPFCPIVYFLLFYYSFLFCRFCLPLHGLTANKAISTYIHIEQNRQAASLTVEEQYEKEVEEKVRSN
jgi:hypothetical protein